MASPFTTAVVECMRFLYPEPLADKSFDNTGLLLQAPFLGGRRKRNSVLLAIDLTKAVAEEAIENEHSIIVAYHPIIFRGLKSITLDDSQQKTLLQLAAHGISVYCPHTAVDVVPGGMGDWLCDVVTGKLDSSTKEASTTATSPTSDTDRSTSASEQASSPTSPKKSTAASDQPAKSPPKPKRPNASRRTYSKPTYPKPTSMFHSDAITHSRRVITPSPTSALDAANSANLSTSDEDHRRPAHANSPQYHPTNTGAGRLITFHDPQPLTLLITRMAHAIGLPKGFPVAIPQYSSAFPHTIEDIQIRTVGVCPGSGASVLRNCSPTPDLIFTGEMSHHDALAVTERGGCVVTLFHSNSERGFLYAVMKQALETELQSWWGAARKEWMKKEKEKEGSGGWDDGVKEILQDETADVVVSERDRDPYGIVVLEESEVQGVTLRGEGEVLGE